MGTEGLSLFQYLCSETFTILCSACYSALKMWQKALEDALVSISKDPKYIKGYYRLSSAQTELQLFDDAETTLKAALTLEPESEVITRQLKALKVKRATAAAGPKKVQKQLDEAQIKEVSFPSQSLTLSLYNLFSLTL